MRRRSRARLSICLALLASFAAVALGVAAPSASGPAPKTYYFVNGHAFGIGEQQVYLIERHMQLTLRYRDENGELRTRILRQNARSSVAWTIEGIASGGGPVLGVATAAPKFPSAAAAVPANYATEPQPESPPPSPVLDSQGASAGNSTMAEVAPASLVLSSIGADMPEIGKPWKSSGDLRLPYGKFAVRFDNVVAVPSGDQDGSLVQIASTGAADFRANVAVPGVGAATLRGGGTSSCTTFLESKNKLLLGMSLNATSHGNASVKKTRGNYDLGVKIAIKLARYVPGIPPYAGSPGFVPASGYLGSTTAPDTQIYSTAVPDKVAVPAPTDTGFVGPPLQPATPYASAMPAMSLPPIPISVSSNQPMASPPAPPTPTPQPTHY